MISTVVMRLCSIDYHLQAAILQGLAAGFSQSPFQLNYPVK
jgi:hypothetical protein